MTPVMPIAILPHSHAATNNSAGGSPGPSGSGSAAGSGTVSDSLPANMQISQAGFLQLISTQMRSQNPLNPTDPTQFLAQIEGLSQVSSLQSIQASMSGLAAGLQGAQLLSGTSLLGHSVLAAGATATLAAGGSVSGAVNAPTGASGMAVAVTDASGALVDAFAVPPAAAGYTPFTWNGMTSQGVAAPAGQYSIQVTAAVGGATQSVNPYLYSKVTSVTIDPSTQALQLNTSNGPLPLSSVINIQ